MEKRLCVTFNSSFLKIYEDLHKKGLILPPFSKFVQDAFYDKINEIREKKGLIIDPNKPRNGGGDEIANGSPHLTK